MKCRHCHASLDLEFIDLGTAPPSNAYLDTAQLSAPERWFPLRVFVCRSCWLVQTEDYAHHAELFASDYAYFSSFSSSWLQHAQRYVQEMATRFALSPASHVVEVACNDGYLLRYVEDIGIPCLGIEPTAGTAAAARRKGIEVREEFFGIELAEQLRAEDRTADLTTANNVLAHVPDINDFVAGFARLLKPQGVATFEFPHLMQLVDQCQFDTIYHEHFSYLSLTAAERIFQRNGLAIFDVEELPTHGGSLRVFAQRLDTGRRERSAAVDALQERETSAGLSTAAYYQGFQARADRLKNDLLRFLLDAKQQGKTVMAYGAAAKGNTLLNYAGIRVDLLPCAVDLNPAKQGRYTPGSRIPIVTPQRLEAARPDYVLILPWNLKAEVVHQLQFVRQWGAAFVTAVPRLEILR
jgi:ubiquinone/menaquinone biosynthesis C-methylase UbiE